MKVNKLLLWIVAAAAVIVSGCEDDDELLGTPSIVASETELSFSWEGGATNAQTISLISTRDWTASSEDWVIISPASGTGSESARTITIYVEANAGTDRSATITFATTTVEATVTVSQSGSSGADMSGTSIDDPYTVEEALAIINAGTYTSESVYVKGIISQIDEVSTSYGNATYYISDDGTTTNQLEIYRGYSLNGGKFASEDEIKAGDEVIVYGVLTMYYSTPEMSTGSSIISINGSTSSGDSGDSGDAGDDSGDEDTYATVSISGAVLTVTDSNVKTSSSTMSYDFSAAGYENESAVESVTLSDGTTISFAQNDGNNPPLFYTNGNAVRMYARNSMIVTGSKAIAKIDITCSTSSHLDNDELYATVDGNTWEVVNYLSTGTSGGTQLRVVSVVITYAE